MGGEVYFRQRIAEADRVHGIINRSMTSADNPRTPQLAEHLGAAIYKRYRVYRKWLAGVPLDGPFPPTDPEESPGLSPNENPRRVAAHDEAI